jgi:DNA repair protein RecN (Recombination protein N)
MLIQLSIKNYVLIENQKIDFQDGFSVITGETGSGKSIILGSLGLLMGDRADKEVVMQDANKCVVEGYFNISKLNTEDFFKQNDLDAEEPTIIRREVNKNGKSRAFINDTPVTLQVLKRFGLLLMDIHSQNQNEQLNSADYRLNIVDAYANHEKLLQEYKTQYSDYLKQTSQLNNLREQLRTQKNEQEYHQFLFDELETLSLKPGEQSDLEEELNILSHAEEIKSTVYQVSNYLSSSDDNILEKLEAAQDSLEKISGFMELAQSLSERLKSVTIELKDIAEEISVLDNDVEFDQDRLAEVEERLNDIYSLNRKHAKNHSDELIQLKEDLSSKIYGITELEEKIKDLEGLLVSQLSGLEDLADQLHLNRSAAAQKIENLVIDLLKDLGLKNAQLKIEINKKDQLTFSGWDITQFLFSANKGAKLADMKKVASGGEMSRLMLSFKYVMALVKSLPSIIFDEVDTGVSGEVADKLAGVMEKLGQKIQVISITHLPQVAARAKSHYLVYKENESIFARSKIKKLNNQQRLHEIASMLSGSQIEDSAIKHAEKLLRLN